MILAAITALKKKSRLGTPFTKLDKGSVNSYRQTDGLLFIKFDEVITVYSGSTFKLREKTFTL